MHTSPIIVHGGVSARVRPAVPSAWFALRASADQADDERDERDEQEDVAGDDEHHGFAHEPHAVGAAEHAQQHARQRDERQPV